MNDEDFNVTDLSDFMDETVTLVRELGYIATNDPEHFLDHELELAKRLLAVVEDLQPKE